MAPHHTQNNVTIIADYWKAPLHTVASTLAFLSTAQAKRKIIVIGTVSDFPGATGQRYRMIARQALDVADIVVFVGRWAASASKLQDQFAAGRLMVFDRLEACNGHLKATLQPDDLLLLKGSVRQDHLERIILDRTNSVDCWRHRCKRQIHCENCDLLSENAQVDQHRIAVHSIMSRSLSVTHPSFDLETRGFL